MRNLFDPATADEVRQRIMHLQPGSERQWGSMTLVQTLAHCTSALEMATGGINPKRAPFPANVLGRIIKPLVLGDDKPFRRNSPSAPELFLAEVTEGDFETERARLVAAVDGFATKGAACCS